MKTFAALMIVGWCCAAAISETATPASAWQEASASFAAKALQAVDCSEAAARAKMVLTS